MQRGATKVMNNTQPPLSALKTRASILVRTGRSIYMLGGAAALGLLLFGCSSKDAGDEAPTVTVQVAAAENTAIESEVSADAVLYPINQAAIVPKVSSPVKKFYVDRGTKVHAGQL